MHVVAEVGDARIGIVHGDAWALAGWRFAQDSLHSAERAPALSAVFEQAALDGFASTHTCLPALKVFDTPLGERFVVNNGAAGMPNFRSTRYGLITRLDRYRCPRALTARLYGADAAGVYVDALAVRFDAGAWHAEFERLWPTAIASVSCRTDTASQWTRFFGDEALGRAPLRECLPWPRKSSEPARQTAPARRRAASENAGNDHEQDSPVDRACIGRRRRGVFCLRSQAVFIARVLSEAAREDRCVLRGASAADGGDLLRVAYVAVTALSLPGAAIMTLVGGAIFGLLSGTVLVSFASAIGATLAFLASRLLLRDWVQKKFGDRLAPVNAGIEKEGAFYLFALRLVPLFPFFVVNLVMGLTKIRTWTFYWVSQLGMLAGTIVYVYAGTKLGEFRISRRAVDRVRAARHLSADREEGRRHDQGAQGLRKVDTSGPRLRPQPGRDRRRLGGPRVGLHRRGDKAKVTLVEKHKMGGDCLNTGCVPSKALIRSAKLLSHIARSREFGIDRERGVRLRRRDGARPARHQRQSSRTTRSSATRRSASSASPARRRSRRRGRSRSRRADGPQRR